MASIGSIIDIVFGTKMFKFTDTIGSLDLNLILPAATVLCGGLWLIQLGKDIYSSTQGNGQWKEKTFYSFVKMIVIVAVLNTGVVYRSVIMGTLIGGIPEMIAVKLGELSSVKFIENTIKIFDTYSESKNTIGSLINATLDGSAVIQITASLGFFFMTILTFVIPLTQKYLFEICVYLGPFAFAGILCEYTRDVFNKWLSLSLAVSWMMVIYAISMIIFTGAQSPMDMAIKGVEEENVFTVAIATLVSCILMLMSPVFAFYLFGTIGTGIEKINTFSTAVTGTAVSTTKSVISTAAVKATAMGYNQDGSAKQGAGAAVARAAGKAGNFISSTGSASKSGTTATNSVQDSENTNKAATASQHVPVIAGTSVPKASSNSSGSGRNSNSGGASKGNVTGNNILSNTENSGASVNGNLEIRGTSIPANSGGGQGSSGNSQNASTNNNMNSGSFSQSSSGNAHNASSSSVSSTGGESTVPNSGHFVENTIATTGESSIPSKSEDANTSSQNPQKETSKYGNEYYQQNSAQNMPLEQDIPTINDPNTNINGSIPGKDKGE